MGTGSSAFHKPLLRVVREGASGHGDASGGGADALDQACHCDQIPALVEALMQQRAEILRLRERLASEHRSHGELP